MALSLHRHADHQLQRAQPPWPVLLAWLLCGIAVVHAWLLPTITDPRSLHSLAIQLLQPLAGAGAVVLMVIAAWQHGPGTRRWAWLLHACAILLSITGVLIQIVARAQRTPIVTPLSNTLFLLTYGVSMIGTALYLPLRSWWVGSTMRILLDSIAVSMATLVLLHSLLPLFIQPWTVQFSAQLSWLALDVGVIFTVGILGLRYAQSGGPLVGMMVPSALCLLLADTIFVVISRGPDGALWHFVPGPLYTIFRVLLALGAYRSVTQPPQAPTKPFKIMPMMEWLVWTTIPRGLALAAITTAIGGMQPPPGVLMALLAITAVREALATYEQRRATLTLHLAQQEADAAATQTQDFLARIVHDIAAPLQGLRTVADQQRSTTEAPNPDSGSLHGQLAHIEHMIDQLRFYLQSRTLPMATTVVDLAPLCAAAVCAAQAKADAHELHLRLAFDIDRTTVSGDTVAIRRILDNLLVNAIAASPVDGEVVVRVHSEDSSTLTIDVQDNGGGIPTKLQARIFEPLVRYRGGAGFGLGLAIVRELTRGMGGQCGVRSDGSSGSTFWVRLSRAPDT